MSRRDAAPEALADLATTGAESRWASNGEVEVHVLDYGGDRRPLVVVPGITSPAVTWDFVVRELRDLVRPVVLDVRGRGLSWLADSYTMDDYAADVEAVVDQLELVEPIVLGHSMGARIATRTALRGTVDAASWVVVDPPLCGPGRGGYPTPWSSFAEQLAEGYRGTTADEVRRFYARWPDAELALRARWLDTCDEAAVRATYDHFVEDDFFAWWPAVPAPVAFVYGGASPVVTPEGAAEAASANPRATVQVVPGAGHMIPWDEHAAFLAVVRPLLELKNQRGESVT
ncbi:MAG TPA: alpha/beta hydrolase [Baekduia sp.]